jgi:hypothetical protein
MKKQETLEEVAERLFKTYSNNTSLTEGHYDYMMDKEDFKEASLELSKWQQERSYSEEEVNEMFDTLKRNSIDNVAIINNVDLFISSWKQQFKKK